MQGRAMGVCGQRGLYPTDQSLLEHGLSPLLVGKELHLAAARRSCSGSTFLDLTSCCPPSHLFPLLALPQQQSIQYSQCSFAPSGLQHAFPLPVPPPPCASFHLPVYNKHFLSMYRAFALLRTFLSTTCISSPCITSCVLPFPALVLSKRTCFEDSIWILYSEEILLW